MSADERVTRGWILRTEDGQYLRVVLDEEEDEWAEHLSATEEMTRASVWPHLTPDRVQSISDLWGESTLHPMRVELTRTIRVLEGVYSIGPIPSEAVNALRAHFPGEDVQIGQEAGTVTFVIGDRVASFTQLELMQSGKTVLELIQGKLE